MIFVLTLRFLARPEISGEVKILLLFFFKRQKITSHNSHFCRSSVNFICSGKRF